MFRLHTIRRWCEMRLCRSVELIILIRAVDRCHGQASEPNSSMISASQSSQIMMTSWSPRLSPRNWEVATTCLVIFGVFTILHPEKANENSENRARRILSSYMHFVHFFAHSKTRIASKAGSREELWCWRCFGPGISGLQLQATRTTTTTMAPKYFAIVISNESKTQESFRHQLTAVSLCRPSDVVAECGQQKPDFTSF